METNKKIKKLWETNRGKCFVAIENLSDYSWLFSNNREKRIRGILSLYEGRLWKILSIVRGDLMYFFKNAFYNKCIRIEAIQSNEEHKHIYKNHLKEDFPLLEALNYSEYGNTCRLIILLEHLKMNKFKFINSSFRKEIFAEDLRKFKGDFVVNSDNRDYILEKQRKFYLDNFNQLKYLVCSGEIADALIPCTLVSYEDNSFSYLENCNGLFKSNNFLSCVYTKLIKEVGEKAFIEAKEGISIVKILSEI